MRVLDLFSGIGGFSLGLEAAGMETVAFCEREPFCQAVLRKHWPDIPIHDDITELNGYAYRGSIDVVCGGFPCQPFSVAGKRRGADDDRALWPQMLRVIRESQPTWVIGENVTGIIEMELNTVLSDLESEGYLCQTFVIPACSVDARHRRDRVWVIAHSDSNSQSNGTKHEQKRLVVGDTISSRQSGNDRRWPGQKFENGNAHVADPSGARLQGSERRRAARTEKQPSGHTAQRCKNVADSDSGVGKTFNQERLLGKQSQKESAIRHANGSVQNGAIWESESGIRRTLDGVSNRSHRIKSLGNAVVPQVVAEIGKAIMAQA